MEIRDLGEQGLLQRLHAFCPPHLIGDDAALLEVSADHHLVVTTDTMVDGVHFSWGVANPEVWTTSPNDAGWRVAAANLSDLAAMGAHPIGLTVGLSVPPTALVADIESFYQGVAACLAPFEAAIAGGDVCRSSVMAVTIAAFGEVRPAQAIRRSQAKPGDAIVVTGYHGSSRAGLELLLHPDLDWGLGEGDRHPLIRAHQRPIPRIDVVNTLRQLEATQDQPWRVAGMDSSDGLADAVLQICRASGVGARIDRNAIPIHPALKAARSPQDSLHWALYGGEDFELVLCCEEAIAHQLLQHLGPPATIVGHITTDPAVVLTTSSLTPSGFTDSDSRPTHSAPTDPTLPDEPLDLSRGFQHF